MKLQKISAVEQQRVRTGIVSYKQSKLLVLLDEFKASSETVMELDGWQQEYVHSTSAQSAFGKAIRRYGFPFKCVRNNKRLYLMKTLEQSAQSEDAQ